MSNANGARRAHDILDGLTAGHVLSRENEKLLRGFLPERPKQKTLDEICALVEKFYDDASTGQGYLPVGGAKILPQIAELYEQLKGLIDAQPTAPALPEGMRLADHEGYGRVVVSPATVSTEKYQVFHLDNSYASGVDASYVGADTLKFIDAEPAKPAHPEFLETAADYENAPDGTIVEAAAHGWARTKYYGSWRAPDGKAFGSVAMSVTSRRVLRWGWGE